MDADTASVPETHLQARQMYGAGAPIKEIRAATGLSNHQFDFALKGGPYVAPGVRALPQIKRTRIIRRKPPRPQRPRGDRAALVARLWKSAARQVADIDKRLRQAGIAPAERERDARMMAVMVKTVRELAALDAKGRAGGHDDRTRDGEPEHDSRDIDEFRRELARKIDALAGEQEARPAGEPAGG